jgi:sec-independent protein translocase protein TatC
VAAGAAAAYGVQQHIVAILLKPAGAQQFIYTSPGGGLNFLVQICVYSGVLVSIPIIVYNLMKFIEPVMPANSTKYVLRGSAVAGVLAAGGVVFGYYFGLPSALKFLAHQFTTDQIRALISVQSYLSFVMMFLLASALIFQAPLLMVVINRIKPLKPSKMVSLKNQRWVILISFILGAVISPTPDIRSMMVLSVPMILSYETGIALVGYINWKRRKPKSLLTLLEQDAALQAERLERAKSAFVMQFEQLEPEPVVVPVDELPYVDEQPYVAPEQVPDQQSALTLSDGRTNYQYRAPTQRIRRRVML